MNKNEDTTVRPAKSIKNPFEKYHKGGNKIMDYSNKNTFIETDKSLNYV